MSFQKINIQLLSDGTGETALAVLQAVLVQYWHEERVRIVKHRNIRTKDQMEAIFKKIQKEAEAQEENKQAKNEQGQKAQRGGNEPEENKQEKRGEKSIVVYTLIMPESRAQVRRLCAKHNVECVDILNRLIEIFDHSLESKPKQAGVLRAVDEDYFKRIEAMEFFLKHDDGRLTKDLDSADIILVGVSRTGKTPLSLFLSNKGWKVANVPLVYNIEPPPELFKADQKKIIALTIEPDYLLKIRKNRLEKFGYDPVGGHYAGREEVYNEVNAIQTLFYKRKWPVLNVTDVALEETAGEIVRIVSKRRNISVKIV